MRKLLSFPELFWASLLLLALLFGGGGAHADVMQTLEADGLTRHNVLADGVAVSGSVSAAGSPVTVSNVESFNYLLFGFTATGSGNAVTPECSIDGVTFNTAVNWMTDQAGVNGVPQTSATPSITHSYVMPVSGKVCRVRVSTYGSGTVTAYMIPKRGAVPLPNVGVVAGIEAAGVAVTSKPIGIGGKVNTAFSSSLYSSGNRGDLGQTVNGNLLVEEGGRSWDHAQNTGTATLKSGAGFLHSVCINSKGASANTLTLYDNTAGSGTKIAVIDTTDRTGCFVFDLAFTTGLTEVIATGTSADLTVTWR